MSEIKEVKEVKEAKGVSKTDAYKVHLQKIIYQELGVKVSRDKAWNLFKSVIHGTVEHVLNIEDRKLPLAGVGTFEILETKPRGSKAGLDKDGNPIEGAEAWACVPRFRFYTSSVIDKLVEHSYGLGDHDIEEKHYGVYKEETSAVEVEEAVETAEAVEATEEAPVETVKEDVKEVDEFDGLEDL